MIDAMLLRLGRYSRVETRAPELDGIHTLCEQALRKAVLEVLAVSVLSEDGVGVVRIFAAVVVFRFDRFARSVSYLARALDEFRTLGIEFVSLHEAVDTSTPNGSSHVPHRRGVRRA